MTWRRSDTDHQTDCLSALHLHVPPAVDLMRDLSTVSVFTMEAVRIASSPGFAISPETPYIWSGAYGPPNHDEKSPQRGANQDRDLGYATRSIQSVADIPDKHNPRTVVRFLFSFPLSIAST